MQRNGIAFDITGYGFEFQIRDLRGVTVKTTATVGAGITLLPDMGQLEVKIAAATFDTYSACQYSCGFKFTDPEGNVITPFAGPFSLLGFYELVPPAASTNGMGIVVNITDTSIIVNILQPGTGYVKAWLDALPIFDSDDDAKKPVIDGGGGLAVFEYYKTSATHVDSPSGLPKQILS